MKEYPGLLQQIFTQAGENIGLDGYLFHESCDVDSYYNGLC